MPESTADPLSVGCPDCAAPAGTGCYTMSEHYTTHAARYRVAELRAVEHGTCDLCGQPMVRGTVDGVTDAWHPDGLASVGCPVMPDPLTDWNAYATATQAGLSPGHPGAEHFRPLGSVRCTHGVDLRPGDECGQGCSRDA